MRVSHGCSRQTGVLPGAALFHHRRRRYIQIRNRQSFTCYSAPGLRQPGINVGHNWDISWQMFMKRLGANGGPSLSSSLTTSPSRDARRYIVVNTCPNGPIPASLHHCRRSPLRRDWRRRARQDPRHLRAGPPGHAGDQRGSIHRRCRSAAHPRWARSGQGVQVGCSLEVQHLRWGAHPISHQAPQECTRLLWWRSQGPLP